jgi:peptidoglycan hydrolase-like protein with peptidoglycan-binding domain
MLRQGDSGAAVTELQQLLNAKGINIAVDGIFGDATRAGIAESKYESGDRCNQTGATDRKRH